MNRRRSWVSRGLVAAVAPLMVLAACSGEADGGDAGGGGTETGGGGAETGGAGDGASGELDSVTVGIIGVAADAGLWAAQDEGYFAEEGLDVTLERAGSGASAIAPAVFAGDYDIGSGGLDVVVTAAAQGLPLLALGHEGVPISHATNIPGDEHGDFGMMAIDESITTAADIAGKSVAVTTLQSINTIMASAWLEAEGVDPESVEFIEVPFPEMESVLLSGDVDVAYMIEPFLTRALQNGAHVIEYPIADVYPGRAHAGYYVTAEYAETHPEEIAAFTRAVLKGNDRVMEDPDFYRDIIRTHTEIPEEIVQEMRLPALSAPEVDDMMEVLVELTAKYGVVPNAYEGDPKELLYEAEG